MTIGRPPKSFKYGASIYTIRKQLRKKVRAEKLLFNLNTLKKCHRFEVNLGSYEFNLLKKIKAITNEKSYEIFRQSLRLYAQQVFKLNNVVPKTTERGGL